MKKVFFLSSFLSFSVFSFELSAKIENRECAISSSGEVKTTYSIGVERKLSFSQTKKISMTGLDFIIDDVIDQASQDPDIYKDSNYIFRIHKRNKIYYTGTETKDTNTLNLIKLIVQICQ